MMAPRGGIRMTTPSEPQEQRAGSDDWILARLPDGTLESIAEPLIPLLDTTLLTNAPGEPRVGSQVLHEMVLGTADELRKHAALMKKFPEMEHDEPHMAHVKPGKSGAIVWQNRSVGAASEFSRAKPLSLQRERRHRPARQVPLT